MNVERREENLTLDFDTGATVSVDLAKIDLSDEQIHFIRNLARRASDPGPLGRTEEHPPVQPVLQSDEFENVRRLYAGLHAIEAESDPIAPPSLTPDVDWCDALSRTDQHESRRAVADYVQRDRRPGLSLGHLVDALLRWRVDTQPVSFELAAMVVVAALAHPDAGQSHPVGRRTVSRLSKQVLGWTIALPDNDASSFLRPDHRVLSRAVAAGVYPLSTDKDEPLVDPAREACVALHSCSYAEAARALTVLCGHMNNAPSQILSGLLSRFLTQSHAHLTALAAAYQDSALAWELRVLEEPYRRLTCRS